MEKLKLGFAEKEKSINLISYLFPDKIGGKPAWLALNNIPGGNDLQCPYCNDQMDFLLQIYSSINEKVDCFHRTLFVFMCTNGICYKNSQCPFRVFRSQLPRKNQYYSYEPPQNPSENYLLDLISNSNLPDASLYETLCPVCGCKANKRCSKCNSIAYCSKKHQVWHWTADHKMKCNDLLLLAPKNSSHNKIDYSTNDAILPEFNLCSEEAELNEDSDDQNEFTGDIKLDEEDDETAALEDLARIETAGELLFETFKEAMANEPDQVVRFQRGGTPIWLSETPPEIPNCEVCGAKRVFEFQVTPQLLLHLKLDKLNEASPDFGSLYVFTCADSCALPRKISEEGAVDKIIEYQQEYIVCQPVP